MNAKTVFKIAAFAVLFCGMGTAVFADELDDLEKALAAELGDLPAETKTEIKQEIAEARAESVKEAVKGVVDSVKDADAEKGEAAADGGSEAVVAIQEQPAVAEAKADPPVSFNVTERVAQRTAEALKMNVNEIGNFDHKKKRIVVTGEATIPMDVSKDKSGAWALKRTMLAKSALLNAKLQLVTALSTELTAEEQQSMFNLPADTNSTDSAKSVVKTSSKVQFASSHPVLGATVLLQEESLIGGELKIAVSMVWSEALQKSAVATMCGSDDFTEAKKGKKSLGEWIDSQNNPALMIGPRQYLDKDGVRHFLGVSAFPIGKNTALSMQNKRKAQLDAISIAAFSCLSDIETSEAMENIMEQVSSADDLDAMAEVEVQSKLESMISQKIQGQMLNGVGKVFEKEIEHPLFPGGQLYVCCYELNAESAKAARTLSKKAYLDRAKVAYANEKAKAIKAKYALQVKQAAQEGKRDGEAAQIEKYEKVVLNIEKAAEKAKGDKAQQEKVRAQMEQLKGIMKDAGVYDKYADQLKAIDGIMSADNIDADDVNID